MKPRKKKKIIVVSLINALCLLGDSMLYVALPIYYHQVGLISLWEVGLILSLNRLVRIPLNPVVAWMYRRFQIRTGLIIAVLLAIGTTFGYGLLTGLIAWIILRCLWGFAWALFRLGGYLTVIKESPEEHTGYHMGLFHGLSRLGSLGGMLGGGILASLFSLPFTALVFGTCMLVGFPFVLFMMRNDSSKEVSTLKSRKFSMLSLLKNPDVVKVVINSLLIAFLIQGMFMSTLSYIMVTHYSEDVSLFGLAISAAILVGIIQAIRSAWEPLLASRFGALSDTHGRIPILMLSLTGGAIGFALMPFSLPAELWVFVVLGICLMAIILNTVISALAGDMARKTNPTGMISIHAISMDIGAALGPLISYLIISLEHGMFYTYGTGFVIFVGLLLMWLLDSKT